MIPYNKETHHESISADGRPGGRRGLADQSRLLADSFVFTTNDPDGKMAMASRPDAAGKIEIESADDFPLTSTTRLTGATFTGLIPTGASGSDIMDVRIEIYRVFPKDSSFPPSGNVPVADQLALGRRIRRPDASANSLTFTTSIANTSLPPPTRFSTASTRSRARRPEATAPSRGKRSSSASISRRRSCWPPTTTSSSPRSS